MAGTNPASKFVQTNYTLQDSATYKANIDSDINVMKQIAAAFAPHAQDSPNMTIRVDAGSLLVGTAIVSQSGQNTGTITAPSTYPRLDLVVIDSLTGAVSVITGTEAVSPSLPAVPAFKLPIAQIALSVGQSSITNSNITDLRMAMGSSGFSNSLMSSVRQTVLSGPVDSSGLPTFLPSTATGLSITSQNITTSAPLVVSAAGGCGITGEINNIGQTTSNLTWSGLTNTTTNYLYVTINEGVLTTGSTTLEPIYQRGGTPSTTAGQATYNINQGIMYLGNGSSAVPTALVFVGEAVTSGGNVTSTVAYAYNGKYASGYTNTLPNPATQVSKSHNIGTTLIITGFRIKCISAEGGYAVNDVVNAVLAQGASGFRINIIPTITGRNTMMIISGSAPSQEFNVIGKSTGNQVILTASKWAYELYARREF